MSSVGSSLFYVRDSPDNWNKRRMVAKSKGSIFRTDEDAIGWNHDIKWRHVTRRKGASVLIMCMELNRGLAGGLPSAQISLLSSSELGC